MQFLDNTQISFVVLPHTFTAIRILNNRIVPVNMTLKISIAPLETLVGDQDAGIMAAKGFQKLKLWLDIALYEVVLINIKNPMLEYVEEYTENTVIYVPREPDDFTLSALLHSKMTEIVKGHLQLDTICLSSSDTFNVERYYRCRDGKYGLPGIEYLGEEAVHSLPWWSRYGLETVDFAKNKVQNVNELLEALAFADEELQQAADEIELVKPEKETEAEIVTVDIWKKDEK